MSELNKQYYYSYLCKITTFFENLKNGKGNINIKMDTDVNIIYTLLSNITNVYLFDIIPNITDNICKEIKIVIYFNSSDKNYGLILTNNGELEIQIGEITDPKVVKIKKYIHSWILGFQEFKIDTGSIAFQNIRDMYSKFTNLIHEEPITNCMNDIFNDLDNNLPIEYNLKTIETEDFNKLVKRPRYIGSIGLIHMDSKTIEAIIKTKLDIENRPEYECKIFYVKYNKKTSYQIIEVDYFGVYSYELDIILKKSINVFNMIEYENKSPRYVENYNNLLSFLS
jgi:hypothetical protein